MERFEELMASARGEEDKKDATSSKDDDQEGHKKADKEQ